MCSLWLGELYFSIDFFQELIHHTHTIIKIWASVMYENRLMHAGAVFAYGAATVSAAIGAYRLSDSREALDGQALAFILFMGVSALSRVGLLCLCGLCSQCDSVDPSPDLSAILAGLRLLVNGSILLDAIF